MRETNLYHILTTILARAGALYRRVFAIHEIETSPTLQVVAWVLLLGWFVQFNFWSRFSDFTVNAVEAGRHLCWPFFQSCGEWYFLAQEPLGASHYAVYAFWFVFLLVTAYTLIRRQYVLAHLLFLTMFVWEITVLLFSMRLAINYWYFHIIFAAVFLFPLGKLFMLRLFAVLLYFFSGILKLTDSWFHGAYFTALEEGLYFIPDTLIPLATNAVIFMELVLVWLLLGTSNTLRWVVLGLLVAFHSYSIMYIGYIFPSIVFPMVLVLFISQEQTQDWRVVWKKNIVAWLILLCFLILHFIPYTIEGDARITGEGNRFGMYMFEANYQCQSTAYVHMHDSSVQELSSRSFFSNFRCDPYAHYFYLKQICTSNPTIDHITWRFDSSIDGSPLMRIVDVQDVCALTYKPFTHNSWILIPGKDDVEIIGPVSKNRYHHGGHDDFGLNGFEDNWLDD